MDTKFINYKSFQQRNDDILFKTELLLTYHNPNILTSFLATLDIRALFRSYDVNIFGGS